MNTRITEIETRRAELVEIIDAAEYDQCAADTDEQYDRAERIIDAAEKEDQELSDEWEAIYETLKTPEERLEEQAREVAHKRLLKWIAAYRAENKRLWAEYDRLVAERRNRHCSQFDELEEIRAGIASALAAAEAHRDNYDDALADEHNRLVAQEMSRLVAAA